MELSKISTRKIYEVISDQMEQLIVGGTLKPGDKLPSGKELSEKFQVGRSTVREALSALKAKGLVEIRQGEGSYVRRIEPDDVELPGFQSLLMNRETVIELIEARKALEISIAGLAAEKRTDEDIAELERIIRRMSDHLGDEEEGERSDLQFHLALARAAHNSIMLRLVDTISNQMQTAIRETRRLQMYASKTVSTQLWSEHRDIYEAVLRQNADGAQEAMRKHLFHVEQVLLKFLKK
ncbi:FadR/GntR family transcriptional regulator [Paenibacillus thalictri]|uniref:FadR family transcriptional regulator n=1 Tax=Paenibacillus thalictri TaxID=2527873 RepID=A0A4Q9DMT8_9BACL|nr:FadR/GntR family transcriptional regulator [Paenibacillus thalictri]TBL75127.1 FadR family transcriptional regulator [Paenibacillus thalictri]